MKKIVISILALAALVSCSKTALDNEAAPLVMGESISVNLPAPTKAVTVSNHEYQFQGGESLIVVSSEGKIATLTNTAESPYSFSGEFDGALGADSDSFTVYFNCYSASAKALSFSQNGQPWLTASLSDQTRGEDGHYSLSPVLEAVEGVKTVAVVSDYAGTVSFHAKTANISYYSGGSFSGSKDINDLALTADNNGKYTAFVNIPSGMTGGYWLKVTKEGESGAMYKSYATSETISENKQVTLSEFTPAEVSATIDLSGLKSSYSYYAEGNAATANATANDVISGSVPYTISGISSKLPYEVSLAVSADGSSAPKVNQSASTTGLSGTFTGVKLSSCEWGARTVTATLILKVGGEQVASTTASATRYITGLPYSVNFSSQPSTWSRSDNTSWSNGLKLGGGTGSATAEFSGVKAPSSINVSVVLQNVTMATIKALAIENKSKLKVTIGGVDNDSVLQGPSGQRYSTTTQSYSSKEVQGTLSSNSYSIKLEQTSGLAGCYCTIGSLQLNYR